MEHTKKIRKIADWLGSGSINIFGMPYAGKDTQGKRLAEFFEAPLLGSGHILRNSVIPPHVRETMDAGQLVPIDEFIKVVLPYLGNAEFTGRPLILSSVGRWKGEEQGVIQATRESGHPIKAVLYLSIPENIFKDRWEAVNIAERGARADDSEHALETRLNEFRSKTLPVVEAYRQLGLVINIDGSLPPNAVTTEIIEKLAEFSEKV